MLQYKKNFNINEDTNEWVIFLRQKPSFCGPMSYNAGLPVSSSALQVGVQWYDEMKEDKMMYSCNGKVLCSAVVYGTYKM